MLAWDTRPATFRRPLRTMSASFMPDPAPYRLPFSCRTTLGLTRKPKTESEFWPAPLSIILMALSVKEMRDAFAEFIATVDPLIRSLTTHKEIVVAVEPHLRQLISRRDWLKQ